MITTFLIYIGSWFFERVLSIMPDASIPSGVVQAAYEVTGWIWIMDRFFAVDTLFDVLGLYLTIEVVILVLDTASWVYSKIPVFGKK